jgi:uncharacterized phage protein (TIGR02218 family)
VPRTSPTCRAQFCGPGCTLSGARFTHDLRVAAIDREANAVSFAGGPGAEPFRDGSLRWVEGPQTGQANAVVAIENEMLVLEKAIDPGVTVGHLARVREGCDHTIATCAGRFGNSINFQGEPFLPGNDILTRMPAATS